MNAYPCNIIVTLDWNARAQRIKPMDAQSEEFFNEVFGDKRSGFVLESLNIKDVDDLIEMILIIQDRGGQIKFRDNKLPL